MLDSTEKNLFGERDLPGENGESTAHDKAHEVVLTTLTHFEKRYGKCVGKNDQRAVHMFREYEPLEKVRRLQTELLWVKSGQVSDKTCEVLLGRERAARHHSFSGWASAMLVWLAEKKN